MRSSQIREALAAAVKLSILVTLFCSAPAWAGSGRAIFNLPANPESGLVSDASGNLYGAARYGSTDLVYKLSPVGPSYWKFTVVHSFDPATEGDLLSSTLVFDSAGNLYGTTQAGGPNGFGTVFRLSPGPQGWSETTLYVFAGGDGCYSNGVVVDHAGNLFGAARDCGGGDQQGLIFELSPVDNGFWTETILYNSQELELQTPLAIDSAGNLYGGVETGVYRVHPNSDGTWTTRYIHEFSDLDGFSPLGQMMIDAAGNLYGTNQTGGPNRCGTAFKMTPVPSGNWTFQVLHGFGDDLPWFIDGIYPGTSLVLDNAGNVFGNTVGGGPDDLGTIFKLSPGPRNTWVESARYSFTGGADGSTPIGNLLLQSGKFYGVTAMGGRWNAGEVFEFTP